GEIARRRGRHHARSHPRTVPNIRSYRQAGPPAPRSLPAVELTDDGDLAVGHEAAGRAGAVHGLAGLDPAEVHEATERQLLRQAVALAVDVRLDVLLGGERRPRDLLARVLRDGDRPDRATVGRV